MYGLDSGVASASGGGGGGMAGGIMGMIQKLMGGMGGGGGAKGGGSRAGTGGGGGGLGSGKGNAIGPAEGTWGSNDSGAGPPLRGGPPVSYTPPANTPYGAPPDAAVPAATGVMDPAVMRPRNNANGDFWGPVVQRMVKQYLEQQRNGGAGREGFLGAQNGTPMDRAAFPAEYGKGAGLGGF
jgi:hypothetical protein